MGTVVVMSCFIFFTASLLILIITLGLVQYKGLLELSQLIVSSSQGGAASHAEGMMNWRMIGVHLSALIDRDLGWIVVAIGSGITAILLFKKFIKKPEFSNKKDLAIFLLGVFAATCIITWHAHYSMSIVFIPPLLFLVTQNQMSDRLFSIWFYLPCAVYFAIFLLSAIEHFVKLPILLYNVIVLINVLPSFLVNLLLIQWSINNYSPIEVGDSKQLSV